MARQHVADMILAAKKDSKHANPLFGLVHLKPIDGPVDRHISRIRQQIVVRFPAKR